MIIKQETSEYHYFVILFVLELKKKRQRFRHFFSLEIEAKNKIEGWRRKAGDESLRLEGITPRRKLHCKCIIV